MLFQLIKEIISDNTWIYYHDQECNQEGSVQKRVNKNANFDLGM